MKRLHHLSCCLLLIFFYPAIIFSVSPAAGQSQPAPAQVNIPPTPPRAVAGAPASGLCAACIRAHMEFLASDALRGRGSGTTDELVAATYVASQLRAYGIAPTGDGGAYLQRATLLQAKFTAPPQLRFAKAGENEEKVT